MYFQKEVKCHSCRVRFQTTKIISNKAKIYKMDSDFCTHSHNDNPILYDVYVCPHCGFAGTEKFRPISKDKQMTIQEQYLRKIDPVPQLCGERTTEDALRAFKLALFTADLLQESRMIKGALTLKIAWINRFLGNETEERRFLEKTLKIYTEIMQTENLEKQQIDEDKLIYMIAELNSRVGDYKVARRWFSHLITDRKISKKYRNLALDRWMDYKMEANK